MYRSLLIVDDFYAEPMKVRQAALSLTYPPVEGQRTFPGRNAICALRSPDLDRVAGSLLGEPVVGNPAPTSFHGVCRITLEGEEGRYGVHCDPSSLWWVGVVYLSLPEHCRGGTAFYRHRALDLDRTPVERRQLDCLGVASVAELLQRDANCAEAWEHLMTVPMRFNRAVLYRPWLWHSAGPGFGDRPENARLVQILSFSRPAA